jgi:hypothetical protein
MSERKVFHVVPGRDGGWEVKLENAERAESSHETKDPAVSDARDRARSHGLGQVIVHKQDGTIQTEYTYGQDPHPPEG